LLGSLCSLPSGGGEASRRKRAPCRTIGAAWRCPDAFEEAICTLDYNVCNTPLMPCLNPAQIVQSSESGTAGRGTVLVVHGLWMNGAVCAVQRAQLKRRGYRTSAFSYSSTRLPLDEIASRLASRVSSCGLPRVHLLAHSLGGLAVLDMLALHPDLVIGRVVLLGTPCLSSRAAEQLASSRIGRKLLGQAILQWRPERGVAAARAFEIGMIAGTMPLGLGRLVARLSAPHDGAVCVDETRLPGLRDHLTMPVSHSGMIVSARVMWQVCNFLEHGHFIRT
jgi:pimeloyl-ACP methyl ester carboxylesterase